MHVKRFEAATLGEALARVKAELGPDALIVSQRSIRRDRGVFGLLHKGGVELTAAVDRDVRRRGEPAAGRVAPDQSWRELRLNRALTEPIEDELRALRTSIERLSGSLPDTGEIRQSIDALRRSVGRGQPGDPAPAGAPPELAQLLDSGVAPQHAREIAAEAIVGRQGADPASAVRRALARRLERRLVPERPDAAPRTVLFVGAPGVGKTTTLAKLAGREKAQDGRLSLVSMDTQRLGCDQTLRLYAEQAQIPLVRPDSPEALRRVRPRSSSSRLFVDTAGRSAGDPLALRELSACREALGDDVQVRLVVSATTKDEDLAWQLERFRPLQPEALVVTKLDESLRLGNVVNLLLAPDAPPLTWVADGQCVPEDLRIPDPDAFAAQVLGAVA